MIAPFHDSNSRSVSHEKSHGMLPEATSHDVLHDFTLHGISHVDDYDLNVNPNNYTNLNFKSNSFDFVLALGVVYEHGLDGAIKCLKEIQRVSKGRSFVTLGSYSSREEFWKLRQWTLLGVTLLKNREWIEVLKHTKYKSDYYFTNANSLGLK